MSRLHPLMFLGTGSDVGKSLLATAFCRILVEDGYHPAPFKAQNMALNSFATPEGLEMGRAQALQAEACGIACHTDMNPILLKPCGDQTSQVIVNGTSRGNRTAAAYFRQEGRDELWAEVTAAYDRLSRRYDPIVLEGAGSIAEINLRGLDIVNLRMAAYAGARSMLVADIERGGVFASLYGSLALLRPDERALVKGIFVNKFRGDIALFRQGVEQIESLCHVPVLGVIPYMEGMELDAEDSVTLQRKPRRARRGKVNIAVVRLRHLSNFTDFSPLESDPRVHLYYTDEPDELTPADILIIPGTKNTIDDLKTLRQNGICEAVCQARRDGKTVMGICGGYQMMGRDIADPDHIEGPCDYCPGLDLLPMQTTLSRQKITRQVRFALTESEPRTLQGYEIHHGRSSLLTQASPRPLFHLEGGESDGIYMDDRCFGTYLHGCFDNPAVVEFLLRPYRHLLADPTPFDYPAFRQSQFHRLAEVVRAHTDMSLFYKILST